MKKKLDLSLIALVGIAGITMLIGATLIVNKVSADDVVDEINITVPMSCTMSGTGQDSHNANINNGTYTANIGTTTMHVFCNDNSGFAIYAAGYTGDEIGGENSNKLVGTNASGNSTIESGLATTAGTPDISNWAMKLSLTQDSGDTSGTNAFTIDSAPNVDLPSQAEQGATEASFSSYHIVPNEYVKVAHKNSNTDMTASIGGVKLTTTYAAYISKTQPADTYTGQVIYTLVHPASNAPVSRGKIGVNYNANGSTFSGGATTNKVVYASSPMYIATTPGISKTSNIDNDGVATGSFDGASSASYAEPVTFSGADRLRVDMAYAVGEDDTWINVWAGSFDYDSEEYDSLYDYLQDVWPADIGEYTGGAESDGAGGYTYTDGAPLTTSFYVEDESVTIMLANYSESNVGYGYYAQVYPIYATEQPGTEASSDLATITTDTGTYANTTNWYGSWYADINNIHYDFLDETEIKNFLESNIATLSGTTVDIYRGLSFDEAYAKANKTQAGGYYLQQDLDMSICQTVAMEQNSTVKDVRDNNTYMIGRLKDGNCWMLDNLALDPTNPTTAANMNASNTNATQEAINNLLNGGSATTGWSSTAVANVTTNFANNGDIQPHINNVSKDTLVTSYGPASTNGQAKVGIYYNFCAASASTYCYAFGQGVDVPDTIIDAPQDICPANWRMPTGGDTGEYYKLDQKYGDDATNNNSLQYNLSTPLSGGYCYGNSAYDQGIYGDWWSSTYSNNIMYFLSVGPYGVSASSVSDRYIGISVRCLLSE